ncbi:class I SAM-dependent methyltransferase [Candidatus Poribacteria bacterium]|nr:class I SAM-dependent methyltransferase [Candidatus Poribacteria bacterium]
MNYLKQLTKAVIPKKYRSAIREKCQWYYRSLLYIGNQLICPCCKGHFRKFLPYGVQPRPNAQCPRCFSLERHRLLWLYLKEKTNLFTDCLKVLHFAPEYQFQKTFRSMPNLDYLSADLYSPLAMVKMDIANILYPENSFDIILCVHVLECVIDDQKAMRELFRVLKPGGWAIIQSSVNLKRDKKFEDSNIVFPEDRERIFNSKSAVRIYGRDYKDGLEKVGFTVKVDGCGRDLGIDMIKKYGLYSIYVLNKDLDIYFCTKPKLKTE